MNTLKKLDLYAASALEGITTGLYSHELAHGWTPKEIAGESFKIADAMLKESEKHEVSDLQQEINALNNLRASDQQTIKMLEKDQAWQKVDKDTKFIEGDGYWIRGRHAPFLWIGTYFSDSLVAVTKNDLALSKGEIIHIPNPNSK